MKKYRNVWVTHVQRHKKLVRVDADADESCADIATKALIEIWPVVIDKGQTAHIEVEVNELEDEDKKIAGVQEGFKVEL